MNERIKELESQSWEERAHGSSWFNTDKFAELIIKECCDVFVELGARPADLAVLDVKKHFGIKEQ